MATRLRPYPTRPTGVPDAAAYAVDEFDSVVGAHMARTFVGPMMPTEPEGRVAAITTAGLAAGAWWWATADWSTFVSAAEATMPESPYIVVDEPPARHGSLWLAEPLWFDASDGTRQAVDVIAWSSANNGHRDDGVLRNVVIVTGWSAGHADDPTEVEVAEMTAAASPEARAAIGRLHLHLTLSVMVPVVDPADADRPITPEAGAKYGVVESTALPTYGDVAAEVGSVVIAHPAVRFLTSAWALLRARATSTSAEPYDRSTRRRMERAGMPTDPVRVVDVRRPTGSGSGSTVEARRDWSHRWVVSGHWRRQWYPSEGVHRTIWIDGYVKGPADAPLLARPTVHRPRP